MSNEKLTVPVQIFDSNLLHSYKQAIKLLNSDVLDIKIYHPETLKELAQRYNYALFTVTAGISAVCISLIITASLMPELSHLYEKGVVTKEVFSSIRLFFETIYLGQVIVASLCVSIFLYDRTHLKQYIRAIEDHTDVIDHLNQKLALIAEDAEELTDYQTSINFLEENPEKVCKAALLPGSTS